MKKKCGVVMLPTEKGAFTKRLEDNQLVLYRESTDKDFQGFHLYITSDDEIKDGDWYIYDLTKLWQYTKGRLPINAVKVIASTDPRLCTNREDIGDTYPIIADVYNGVPQIPESFVKGYVNNPVDEVMVIYNECLDVVEGDIITVKDGCLQAMIGFLGDKLIVTYYRINDDSVQFRRDGSEYGHGAHVSHFNEMVLKPSLFRNKITISPVKDKVYSRDEVATLIRKAFVGVEGKYVPEVPFFVERLQKINDWIGENL